MQIMMVSLVSQGAKLIDPNQFADILARLSVYMLANSDPAYAPLLKLLFTPQSIPDTLVVVLLDWSSPWSWMRQLRHWIQTLRSVLNELPSPCQVAMDENMQLWRDRKKGDTSNRNLDSVSDPNVTLPLGPGEWDEGLGVPISVICQNTEHIGIFEREHAWKDDQFDFILQSLRTVLLKHGGSLLYLGSEATSTLQTLLRSQLDIHSLLQRDTLKHNIVDREKVLVPSNWDSWGKIRVLAESFDVEKLSDLWSSDLQTIPDSPLKVPPNHGKDEVVDGEQVVDAITNYEEVIRNPMRRSFYAFNHTANIQENVVECVSTQEFLASQVRVLEALKNEDLRSHKEHDRSRKYTPRTPSSKSYTGPTKSLSDHIGPVQLNMGGIKVDVEDMLKSMKEREAERNSGPNTPVSNPDPKTENEKLRSFFAGLASRGSPSSSRSPK